MGMMLIVVAMDAFQAIPFAYLRYKKRPVKFAALKLLFIFASIVLNIAYFVGMKGENVGVAFAINLACTSLVMLCMWKDWWASGMCWTGSCCGVCCIILSRY